jgi:hypothetical protein
VVLRLVDQPGTITHQETEIFPDNILTGIVDEILRFLAL